MRFLDGSLMRESCARRGIHLELQTYSDEKMNSAGLLMVGLLMTKHDKLRRPVSGRESLLPQSPVSGGRAQELKIAPAFIHISSC